MVEQKQRNNYFNILVYRGQLLNRTSIRILLHINKNKRTYLKSKVIEFRVKNNFILFNTSFLF